MCWQMHVKKLWKLTFSLLAVERYIAGRYFWKQLFICVNFFAELLDPSSYV